MILARLLVPLALALVLATAAHAAITISTHKTNDESCTAGVCTPTGPNPNLQVKDLEKRLALTNLITGTSNAAIIVWKGNQRPDGWEYGVELVAPEMEFWGMEL